MTFGERVKTLRQELGLSQEAVGSQGFVSTPGWIKIENGQRQASEKLIGRLIAWLVGEKYMRSGVANSLKGDLLTLKYLGSNSGFVRELAKAHAKRTPAGIALLAETPDRYKTKPRRGRPPLNKAKK